YPLCRSPRDIPRNGRCNDSNPKRGWLGFPVTDSWFELMEDYSHTSSVVKTSNPLRTLQWQLTPVSPGELCQHAFNFSVVALGCVVRRRRHTTGISCRRAERGSTRD